MSPRLTSPIHNLVLGHATKQKPVGFDGVRRSLLGAYHAYDALLSVGNVLANFERHDQRSTLQAIGPLSEEIQTSSLEDFRICGLRAARGGAVFCHMRGGPWELLLAAGRQQTVQSETNLA